MLYNQAGLQQKAGRSFLFLEEEAGVGERDEKYLPICLSLLLLLLSLSLLWRQVFYVTVIILNTKR
jgi:hypothetical protein